MATKGGLDVTVLLGTRFDELRHHGTRWRHVLTRWADDTRVGRLTVVDYPRFSVPPSVHERTGWIPGVPVLAATVGGRPGGSPVDGVGWWAAGRQLGRRLGVQDVVVAATPLWADVLGRLPAHRRCFDAVDDWRALVSVQHLRRRIDSGYRAASTVDAATAVAPALADRLALDFGLHAAVVPNGVDLGAHQRPGPPPEGLPEGPFAVYVGVVEQRVDLALLAAAAEVMPVVVAGPSATAIQLPRTTWLGPVAVDAVPGLLSRAAVGLVPHRVDALTESMDPMKVLEYLAAGLPVVSTSVATSARSERLLVADGPQAFAAAVARAAALGRGPGPAWLAQRDWDTVADTLLATYAGGSR